MRAGHVIQGPRQVTTVLRQASALVLGLILIVPAAHAQTTPKTLGGFPIADFDGNAATADWLMAYDRVAWITSDSILAIPEAKRPDLGPEWLCIENDGKWSAMYGRYDSVSDRYTIALQYRGSLRGPFARSTAPVDSAQVLRLVRALHSGFQRFPDSLQHAGVTFNKYVRQLPDRRIEVWYLPAGRPDGALIWGIEVRQVLDSEGRSLVQSEVVGKGLRGIYADTTVTLSVDERDLPVPSAGSIFFLLANRRYFKAIHIRTAHFLSTMVRTSDGQLTWIHTTTDSTAR